MVGYLLLDLAVLAGVIWLYVKFVKWDNKRRKRYDEKYQQETDEYYSVIRRILGNQAEECLKTNYYWKGMPECFRAMYWGIPANVKEIRKPGEETRIYYYDPIEGARANARKKYHREYRFRNRELVYWELEN